MADRVASETKQTCEAFANWPKQWTWARIDWLLDEGRRWIFRVQGHAQRSVQFPQYRVVGLFLRLFQNVEKRCNI